MGDCSGNEDRKMNKDVENVLKLDAKHKYEYFIKKVVDFEEVWALTDGEGWASVGKNDKINLPIWPKKEFAELSIKNEWSEFQCGAIDLYEFIETWIPNLKDEGSDISVFWFDNEGIQVEPEKIKRDLNLEMERYL